MQVIDYFEESQDLFDLILNGNSSSFSCGEGQPHITGPSHEVSTFILDSEVTCQLKKSF